MDKTKINNDFQNNIVKSQTSAVLTHLKQHGSITSMEAIENYGATRLSGIIYCLRARGYDISTELKKVINRYGHPAHIAVYKLKKKDCK